MKVPKIITISGLDGVGKTIQSIKLEESLKALGKKVLNVDFPQYDRFFGNEIGKLLSGKDGMNINNLDAKSIALWYANDRQETLKHINIHDYDYIIFNRYTIDNAVYQSTRVALGQSKEIFDWVFRLEEEILRLPKADINIVLMLSNTFRDIFQKSKAQRTYTDQVEDLNEHNKTLLTKVEEALKRVEYYDERVKLVYCDNGNVPYGIDEIHQLILDVLKKNNII